MECGLWVWLPGEVKAKRCPGGCTEGAFVNINEPGTLVHSNDWLLRVLPEAEYSLCLRERILFMWGGTGWGRRQTWKAPAKSSTQTRRPGWGMGRRDKHQGQLPGLQLGCLDSLGSHHWRQVIPEKEQFQTFWHSRPRNSVSANQRSWVIWSH